jgi:hypothetical protein
VLDVIVIPPILTFSPALPPYIAGSACVWSQKRDIGPTLSTGRKVHQPSTYLVIVRTADDRGLRGEHRLGKQFAEEEL